MILEELKWLPDLTEQEKQLANYILNHPDAVLSATAQTIAMSSYTSKSTVTRLCQKLGFTGYRDFRLQYAAEQSIQEASSRLLTSESIRVAASSMKAPQYTEDLHTSVIRKTNMLLDKQALSRVLLRMKRCNTLMYYGTGTNFFRLQGLCLRLQALGYHAYAYDAYHRYNDTQIGRPERKRIAFVVSTTGKNPVMVECAKLLKKNNVWTVAICSKSSDQLSQLADETLISYWNPEHGEMMMVARELSLQYILDTLFISCYAETLKTHEYDFSVIEDTNE
ncbi:MAG: MurR/RpiR family transcriptional regulator [Clostridia bacterium]|nr:MurR/RpiR family transcriptional regulator [Clostridia bacterium]